MDSNGKIMLCLIKFTGVFATVLRVYLIDIYLSVSTTLWHGISHSQLAAPVSPLSVTTSHTCGRERNRIFVHYTLLFSSCHVTRTRAGMAHALADRAAKINCLWLSDLFALYFIRLAQVFSVLKK